MASMTNCMICHTGGKTIAAKYYCQECRTLMCGRCKTKHQAKSSYKDHLVVTFAPIMNMTCNIHKQDPATAWCSTCSSATCRACDVGKHNKHKTGDLKSHLSDCLSDMQLLDQNMNDISVNISDSKDDMGNQIKHLQDLVAKSEREINDNYANIVDKITNKKDRLIAQLHETIQSQIQKLQNAIQIENDKMQQIATGVETKNNALSGKRQNDLENILNQGKVFAAYKPDDVQMSEVLHFVPEDNIEVGRLINTLPVWETSITAKSVSDMRFTSPTTLLVAFTGYYDGALLCERDDESLTFARQREILQDHRIQSIAVQNDVFYVTCGHHNCKTVHKCLITTHQLTQRGQWPIAMFSDPFGIAITDSGKVVVSDADRREVSIHKSNGDRLVTIGGDAVGKNTTTAIEFISPWYLATHNNKIYLSDFDQDTVFVLDLQGKLLFKIGQDGSKDGELKDQRGICFTDSGNLLVADNDRISQFDPDGTFISHVITSQTADIDQPLYIDFLIHNNNRFLCIIVPDGRTYLVKLFSI